MKRWLLPFLLFPFLHSSCGTPGPVPPTPVPGAACVDVCSRAATLGCSFAQPSPGGVPCTEVCENLRTSGLPSWNLPCMAGSTTCEAMDTCQ
jgi:hypothetical protein